jgi:hypothetical protein
MTFLILMYSCVSDPKNSGKKQNKSQSENIEVTITPIPTPSPTVSTPTAIAPNIPTTLHTCLVYVSSCNSDLSVSTGFFYPIQSVGGEWTQNSCLNEAEKYYNRCFDSSKDLNVVASYYENGNNIIENEKKYEAPNVKNDSVMMARSFCMMKINSCPRDPYYIPANSFFYMTDHSANQNPMTCESLLQTLVKACNKDNTKLLEARAEYIIGQSVAHVFTATNQSTYLPPGSGTTTTGTTTTGTTTTGTTTTGTTTTGTTTTGTTTTGTTTTGTTTTGTTTTGTTTTGTTTTGTTTTGTTTSWWKPGPINSWDIRLDGGYSNLKNVEVYTVDLFDVPKSVVTSLRNKGTKVICYFSAGSYEDWRSDKGSFPSSVKGKNLDGWAGEKWLDVRKISTLKPIMTARMDLAKSKGCHAVDPDNVDGYTQNSGFSISASDQIAYNKMLAEEAHKRGLAVGLKNNLEQITALEPYFDFAVNEQCYQYNECNKLDKFISKGKAVFGIEYELSTSSFCSKANAKSYDFIKKTYDLDSWVQFCR